MPPYEEYLDVCTTIDELRRSNEKVKAYLASDRSTAWGTCADISRSLAVSPLLDEVMKREENADDSSSADEDPALEATTAE